MIDVMYEIPSLSGVKECVITEEVVLKKDQPILIYNSKMAKGG
jgi:ATP-dependent Clp protease ATP-binding subunit ClpX